LLPPKNAPLRLQSGALFLALGHNGE